LNRRTFIKNAAKAGIAIAALPNLRSSFAKNPASQTPLALNALRIPPVISGGDLTIAQTTFKIFPDADANILSINNTFPAPTIKLKTGDTFTAKVINNLSEPTVLHWHGIHAPSAMDGHPKNAIAPGGTFDVNYQIIQRAGTFFYHSHTDMATARQTYMGMAGCFIIENDEELALKLPSGEFEIPLLIQDKRFDANKQLIYKPVNLDTSSGWLGDQILINGTPNANLDVKQTMYRFRLINGSNARIYLITLGADQKPFTIIGNDGGLLEAPVTATSAFFSPAERLDIIIDFSSFSIGQTLILKSASFPYGGDPSSGSLQQGDAFDMMQFTVTASGTKGNPIPATLSSITKYTLSDVKQSRAFELSGNDFINLKMFDMNRIDQHVPLGDLEKWSFINESQAIHPMHVHGTQFQVMDRSGNPPELYEMGWKDVIRVDPSQSVNVLIRFAAPTEYTGIYLVHCHNLEHEDMGMMSNFQIEDSGAVEENNPSENALEIFPNPARDYALLKFPPLENDTPLIIADEKGSTLLKEILSKGSDRYAIISANFASGLYNIKLGDQMANLIIMR